MMSLCGPVDADTTLELKLAGDVPIVFLTVAQMHLY